MSEKKYSAIKDRRDIGHVVFPIEKMMAAREISSCSVGVEALLETDSSSLRAGSKIRGWLKEFCLRVD